MNLKIIQIADKGNIEKERILIKVSTSTDLGKFLLATTRIIREGVYSSAIKNVFWLPDQVVKAGDIVVVYTKKGKRTHIVDEQGISTYFLYWGQEKPISGNTESPCIMLMEAFTWSFTSIESLNEREDVLLAPA